MGESKELTFFDQMGQGLAVTPEEQAQIDAFNAAPMEEARNLPITVPKIEILHQGTARFKFPDDEIVASFNGVIVHVEQQRVWWKYPMGQAPAGHDGLPECYSRDLLTPHSDVRDKQSNACATCPKNTWGSDVRSDGKDSRGKACKELRRVFLMAEGHMNPFVLKVPPSSLRSLGNYFSNLRDKNLGRPQSVLTKFTLINDETEDRVKYSVLRLDLVKKAPPFVIKMVLDAKLQIEKILQTAAPISQSDYFEGSESAQSAS